jgi:hypothetical protein
MHVFKIRYCLCAMVGYGIRVQKACFHEHLDYIKQNICKKGFVQIRENSWLFETILISANYY